MLVYSNLPKHPFWSYVEDRIDFTFADRLCSVLYTGRGQRPFAPSLKLKVHLVETYYALSDRQTEEKIIGDLFVKRFLGLPVDFFGFDHSTIGLDRQRMGTAMFQACHLYILAQMYSLGLWGDRDERWIIDSFPTHAGVVVLSSYRLIQQATIRLINHLKRCHTVLYELANKTLDFSPLTQRLSSTNETKERLLAFSRLAALGHALLHFFETEQAIQLFSGDKLKTARQRSMTLQYTLARILQENTRPAPSDDAGAPPPSAGGTPASGEYGLNDPVESADVGAREETAPRAETEPAAPAQEATIAYEKIPFKERPSDRLLSHHHTDVRKGMKTSFTVIKGFKTQNLCTENSVILNTRVVPAFEHDRDAMVDMVGEVKRFFRVTPKALLGDTAYGHGKQRVQLQALNIPVIAPVPTAQNPTSLYDLSRFTYDSQKDVFRCPGDHESYRKACNKKLNGTQYYFHKQACSACPFQKECTTNAKGRSVFRSDYAELYENAAKLNDSDEGKEAMSKRYVVERKNQEIKNDCGMGAPNATSKKTLSMKATLAGIVVNLKLVVRALTCSKPGFLRRAALAR
jgi:hypothetical protein